MCSQSSQLRFFSSSRIHIYSIYDYSAARRTVHYGRVSKPIDLVKKWLTSRELLYSRSTCIPGTMNTTVGVSIDACTAEILLGLLDCFPFEMRLSLSACDRRLEFGDG